MSNVAGQDRQGAPGKGAAPDWFQQALDAPVETGSTSSGGCPIAFRCWGHPNQPGVVLVHGGAAHSRWWDHIAPLLANGLRVVALDLSGHGDSGRRDAYSMATWANEVLDVASASGISGRPLVIGHSMGGGVTFVTGAQNSDDLAGIIVLDSAFGHLPPELGAVWNQEAFRAPHTYTSRAEAVTKFRTVPHQPTSLPYIIEHISIHSLRTVANGWTWKFDPATFAREQSDAGLLRQISCRVAILRAEHGLVTADIGSRMYNLLGQRVPVIEVPSAWHHMMLDQPLALITGLRSLLADWEHSEPRARG